MDTITLISELAINIMQQYPWFGIVVTVISSASVIAAATPTPKSGSFWAKAYKLIDIAALNIGKAKNK